MAVFDVGPVLEVVTSLQGKLEEAITKSKLLLEAIEGSQSKYIELNSEYPVLRSLKGRLSATQGPNESLSAELVKFKVELEYFVEDIFNAHEKVRQDFQLWVKKLERYDEKSRREKVEFIKDREKFYSERVKYFDTLRLATTGKTKIKENSDDNEKSEDGLLVEDIEEDDKEEIHTDSKSTLETWDAACQTEPETTLAEESEIHKKQDSNGNESLSVNDIHESLGKENHHLLPCRSQVSSATVGRHQRVLTAPVSKAKALLLTKQGHALRMHQMLVNEICKMKEEILFLKTENSMLFKRANEASSELFYMKSKLTVNMADRDELQKKLQKSKEQIQKLEGALRKQAIGLVCNKKQQRQLQEEIRWSQIFAVPLPDSSSRGRSVPQVGKSTRGR
ncbi:uncharacterized protein LOC110042060 [Orbicella faveolata]|uniref:uncharacterized protein LOC110042060 n=1 Tax=Orbicella faveolata TaxID=48498 RepID=UPI0009E1C152|nr:uncharacterized protein LOC110042060 [Orbicella faveolata]